MDARGLGSACLQKKWGEMGKEVASVRQRWFPVAGAGTLVPDLSKSLFSSVEYKNNDHLVRLCVWKLLAGFHVTRLK